MDLKEYSKARREWERELLCNSFRWVKPMLFALLGLGIGSIIIGMVTGG